MKTAGGRRVRWKEDASARANAAERLPQLLGAYYAAGRRVMNGKPSPRELHRLRLGTKRLRYTLELFLPCYGVAADTAGRPTRAAPGSGTGPHREAELESLVGALRKIQDELGAANDAATTGHLILGQLPARAAARRRITEYLDAHAAAALAEFLRFWREEFDSPGAERLWRRYLAGAAASAPKAARVLEVRIGALGGADPPGPRPTPRSAGLW